MKNDLVYEKVTAEEIAAVASAVGLSTQIAREGNEARVWVLAADRRTLLSISDGGDVLSFFDFWQGRKSNAEEANAFNASHGSWGKVVVDRDQDAVLSMAVDVEGVTRAHLALKLLMWRRYVENFAKFFDR